MKQGRRLKMLLPVVKKPAGQQNYYLILVIHDAVE